MLHSSTKVTREQFGIKRPAVCHGGRGRGETLEPEINEEKSLAYILFPPQWTPDRLIDDVLDPGVRLLSLARC